MARLIEVVFLKQGATADEVRRFCDEARAGGFLAAVVLPEHVGLAASLLKDSRVRTGTVVGYPAGAASLDDKVKEAREAVKNGAEQIHAVLNHSAIKAGDYAGVTSEVEAIRNAAAESATGAAPAGSTPAVPDVIAVLETGALTPQQREAACKAALAGGAVSVQASIGAGPRGAMTGEVMGLRKAAGRSVPVRAAGGINGSTMARAFLDAGASIVWSEKGSAILKDIEMKYF